jgi:hypothetical protein
MTSIGAAQEDRGEAGARRVHAGANDVSGDQISGVLAGRGARGLFRFDGGLIVRPLGLLALDSWRRVSDAGISSSSAAPTSSASRY